MQTGWLKLGGSWYYLDPDKGYMYADTAFSLNDHIYGFNTDGTMYTGWCYIQTGNYWLYFDNNGAVNGWKSIGGKWYYFNTFKMVANCSLTIKGVEYYFLSSGALAEGWVNRNGTWYYYSGGIKHTGWLSLNGAWYYLASDGKMATGWLNLNGSWYYLTSSGKMATGWLKLGNTWYYLNANGKMATNTWIGNSYVNGSGAWVRSR